ncbi:MAG TPA: WYL domain-containing protein [Acidimicrobiia bacterium]|jgi:proteasome accessory factor C|nr:WYL domain-containing protein [Acidimicrobiia bacterium]
MSSRTVSRISRILALIPYVLDRTAVDVDEITERFGYTREQLTRDLDTIFVCGLPGYGPGDLMEAYLDEDEVVIDAADFFAKAPRLTPTEALGLLAAGLTVIASGEASPALESAVRKLTKAVIPEADTSLVVDVPDESKSVGALRDAAADQHVVRITYRSVGREETTGREIEPWSVFTTLGRWYVLGHCRLVDGQRTFRVDRIKEMTVLPETFERPAEIPEPFVGYTPSDDDIVSVIDLAPAARWVLEYYPVEVISESKDRTRIRFHSPDTEVPARLLLRLGTQARLVEGAKVAERVEKIGSAILSAHQ